MTARYGFKLRSAGGMHNQLWPANEYIRTRWLAAGACGGSATLIKPPASPFEAYSGAGSIDSPASGTFQQVGGFGDAGGGFGHPGGELAGPNRVPGGKDLA